MTAAIVQRLEASAAPDLADIHASAFHRPWSADEFAALMTQPGVMAWGVLRRHWFRPARLAGFVALRVAADEAEVLSVAVRPQARGRGYGRLLMEEALRSLYRDRIKTCFLEVDGANTVAVQLYRSLGFEIASERKGYYGGVSTALVMRLGLEPGRTAATG